MSPLRLSLRTPPSVILDAPSLRPDRLSALTGSEIERLPVWHGHEAAQLADFFAVEGGGSDDVRIEGDLTRIAGLAEGMQGGRILLEGRAGFRVGAGMAGGHLVVLGDAGDEAGVEMRGGVLEIRGDAGDGLAGALPGDPRGMRGGTVLVHGSVGRRACNRMRRGTVAVLGGAGRDAGCHMVAGTLLVCGDLASRPGIGMKRGTILAGGGLELLPTFRYASTDRPGFLPLLWRSLLARGFPLPERLRAGGFRRYGGDYADLGRGEILHWTSQP